MGSFLVFQNHTWYQTFPGYSPPAPCQRSPTSTRAPTSEIERCDLPGLLPSAPHHCSPTSTRVSLGALESRDPPICQRSPTNTTARNSDLERGDPATSQCSPSNTRTPQTEIERSDPPIHQRRKTNPAQSPDDCLLAKASQQDTILTSHQAPPPSRSMSYILIITLGAHVGRTKFPTFYKLSHR